MSKDVAHLCLVIVVLTCTCSRSFPSLHTVSWVRVRQQSTEEGQTIASKNIRIRSKTMHGNKNHAVPPAIHDTHLRLTEVLAPCMPDLGAGLE